MKQLKREIKGVYLLINAYAKIVYVGQSQDILKRLAGHRNKDWDSIMYEEIENADERAEKESALIKKYQPIYNKMSTKIIYPDYTNRIPKKSLVEMLQDLKVKHENSWCSFSSRQIRTLLYNEYGAIVSHVTVCKYLRVYKLKGKC